MTMMVMMMRMTVYEVCGARFSNVKGGGLHIVNWWGWLHDCGWWMMMRRIFMMVMMMAVMAVYELW